MTVVPYPSRSPPTYSTMTSRTPCPVCYREFSGMRAVRRHVFDSDLPDHIKAAEALSSVICPNCASTFPNREGLTTHVKRGCGESNPSPVREVVLTGLDGTPPPRPPSLNAWEQYVLDAKLLAQQHQEPRPPQDPPLVPLPPPPYHVKVGRKPRAYFDAWEAYRGMMVAFGETEPIVPVTSAAQGW